LGTATESQETFGSGQNTIELTPGGAGVAPVRFPALPSTFTQVIYDWLIFNHSETDDVWVNFDNDADDMLGTGYKIPPQMGKRLPIQTKAYISVAGGDGVSVVDCDPFRYDKPS